MSVSGLKWEQKIQAEIEDRIRLSNEELKKYNYLRIAKRNQRSLMLVSGSILLFGLIAHIFMQI